MRNRISILIVLITILFAATASAGIKERLVPITSGKVNIGVDSFIVGTHDKYIATIVRNYDEKAAAEVGDTMRDMASLHDGKSLVLVEKIVFDKNSKKLSMVDRYMTLESDLQARYSSEPMVDSGMHEAAPGTLADILWNKVAGPDGLGRKILDEDPAPVALTEEHKYPVDANRYVVIGKDLVGGLFLDKDSIKKTNEGCSAVLVQSFDYDGEVHYGGLAMQHTYQPYVDAQYAISTYEYSFEKKAHRLLRFTKYAADGKVIYSIRSPHREWITAGMDPLLPSVILAVRAHLPKDVAELLSDDLSSFDAFIAESAKKWEESQAKKAAEESREKPQNAGTAGKK